MDNYLVIGFIVVCLCLLLNPPKRPADPLPILLGILLWPAVVIRLAWKTLKQFDTSE
jgi:hypothetical protein